MLAPCASSSEGVVSHIMGQNLLAFYIFNGERVVRGTIEILESKSRAAVPCCDFEQMGSISCKGG